MNEWSTIDDEWMIYNQWWMNDLQSMMNEWSTIDNEWLIYNR